MTAPPEVMARIGCARMLLMRSKDTAQHTIVLRLQTNAVVDLMQRQAVAMAAMTPGMRAKMGALATAGAWHPDDIAQIMNLVKPPAPVQKEAVVRAKMQKFTPNILHYFTAAEWERMKGQQSLGVAVDFLISRLQQLGGRCLSEPCKAWCASLLLSLHGMSSCTETTRKQVLDHFKQECSRRGRNAPRVEPFLVELPQPSELKANHPQLYYAVFAGAEPVPSQIEVGMAGLPRVSCRSTSKHSAAMIQAEEHVLATRKEQPAGALPMHFLEQIVTLQQDNMQLIKDTVVGRQCVPKSLVALTSQPAHHVAHQGSPHGILAPSQQTSFGVPNLNIGHQSQQASLGVPRLAIASGPAFPAETLQSQDTQDFDNVEGALLQIVPVATPPLGPQLESMPASSSTAPADNTALVPVHTAPAGSQLEPMPASSSPAPAASTGDSCLAQKILREMGAMGDARADARAVKKKEAAPKKEAAAPKKKVAAPKKKVAAPKKAAAAAEEGGVKRKHARVDHEASRRCWRVRFPDGTSRGFKYKEGEAPMEMRKQAEDYVRERGFEVVE